MAYVDAILMTNEYLVAKGKIHWWIYIRGILFVLLGLLLVINSTVLGIIFVVWGSVALFLAWIQTYSTEFAVTNKRIIAKYGLIRRNTVELLHKNVESLHVHQGYIGRLLNFGTVEVRGVGTGFTYIHRIVAPLEFRRKVINALEA